MRASFRNVSKKVCAQHNTHLVGIWIGRDLK